MSGKYLLYLPDYNKVSAKTRAKPLKMPGNVLLQNVFYPIVFQDDFQKLLPTIENNSKCY